MTVSTFESLPIDVLFEIFGYLSAVHILQSFIFINKRLSRSILHEYFWNIHIGDSTMSLSMFDDLCQNVLKLIGGRVISLRITLSNAIGGWALVSSSLQCHQTVLLRHLHLIDITPHEFNKLLRNHVIKQLRTLLVDVAECSSFHGQIVEGFYLAKVCSQLPLLTVCRLPFNISYDVRNQLGQYSPAPLISLPNLLNTKYLRTLTIGMSTSYFLTRLLSCIPLIENLSIGVNDHDMNKNDASHITALPAVVDIHLPYLSRLHLNCLNNTSFHGAIALFSSVFGQLSHFALKFEIYSSIFDPCTIFGDTIQQLCIDRLKSVATYSLCLLFNVMGDFEEKTIFNSFFKVPFTRLLRPRVFIQERDRWYFGPSYHCFIVYTLPYNDTMLSTDLFSSDLQMSSRNLVNPINLFRRANKLFITGVIDKSCQLDLDNPRSSLSSLVPWSRITEITVDVGNVISAAELEAILRMAYNVHTLQIYDNDILPRAIFRNTDNLGTRINEQIRSFIINDCTLTLYHAQDFCRLLSNRLFNLKNISFNIHHSSGRWTWKPSCIVDGENTSTKRITNLIYFLVDHLQQLVSLEINFFPLMPSETPCFPYLIRRQLHQQPLSRPYRLRCCSYTIQIWL